MKHDNNNNINELFLFFFIINTLIDIVYNFI